MNLAEKLKIAIEACSEDDVTDVLDHYRDNKLMVYAKRNNNIHVFLMSDGSALCQTETHAALFSEKDVTRIVLEKATKQIREAK